MTKRLQDLLVVCDMDGTLLQDDKTLSEGNLQAIEEFVKRGGRFAIASGKTVGAIRNYASLLPFLSPSVTAGGCVIYDFVRGKTLESRGMPMDSAKKALEDIQIQYPQVGIVITAEDGYMYFPTSSFYSQELVHEEHFRYYVRDIEDLPDSWVKFVVAADTQTIEDMQELYMDASYAGTYFINTGPTYLELMPVGVTKASGLRGLCRLMKVKLNNTIVIGDYYNDVDILKIAGRAVAMQNAPKAIRDMADEVIGSNQEDGVGHYLRRLMEQYR